MDDPWAAEQSRCSVAGSRANPLVVEWPAADRGSLEVRLRRGVVAVRYEGCAMKVLRRCSVPGSAYSYGGFTHKAETVRMANADELYANLPVGAARLEAQLERAKALEVSMTMVGMYDADRDAVAHSDLRGDCSEATHIIAGVQVGAYAFFAEGKTAVGAAAGLATGPKLGGRSSTNRELLEQDGDPSACLSASSDDAQPPDGCGALLRVEVVPIGASSTVASACPPATHWDGSQCSSPPPDPSTCPPGFADAGEGCQRGLAEGADLSERCDAGMSWIPGERAGDGFCLDDTEVTTWAYNQCVSAGACPVAATTVDWSGIDADERDGASVLCNALRPDRASHPINCVTWHSASTYCGWRDAQLPTEREFSWAARGGDLNRRYPWGEAAPGPGRVNACGEECRAWFRRQGKKRKSIAYRGDDGWPTTSEVGSFPAGASRWGPLDLAGNVSEWTADWSDDEQTRRRVLGGSFLVQRPSWLSTADTAAAAADRRDAVIGFRCADRP